jgi:hypothetical protein
MSSLTPRLDKLDQNYIINGNMDFWQRNTTFASPATASYTADRFQVNFSNAATRTVSRSTLVPDIRSTYSLQYVVGTADATVAAGDFENLHYHMEGYDFRNLAGKEITVSFWVRSSITGTYAIAFRNDAVNRSYVTTYSVSVANTWEKKTIHLTHDVTGTWLYDNNTGINISFALMSGTTFHTPSLNSWQAGNYISHSSAVNFMGTAGAQINITQLAVYEGTLEDPEFSTYGRNFEGELRACQRYYEKSYDLSVVPGTASVTAGGLFVISISTISGCAVVQVHYKASKRAIPVVTFYNSITGAVGTFDRGGTPITFAISAASNGVSGFNVANTAVTNAVNGHSGQWAADAELV